MKSEPRSAGELIQSLEREVDADAEAAWSDEIRSRSNASTRAMPRHSWSDGASPASRGSRTCRELEYLDEALEEAEAGGAPVCRT